MEEKGYIEIRITNSNNTLSVKDVDINDVKKFISDVETFLYPNNREDKKIILLFHTK